MPAAEAPRAPAALAPCVAPGTPCVAGLSVTPCVSVRLSLTPGTQSTRASSFVYEGEGDESADTTPGDVVFRLRVREEGGFSRLGAKGLAYEAPRMRAGDVAYCAAVRTVGGGVVACAGWAARARLRLCWGARGLVPARSAVGGAWVEKNRQ